MKKIKYLEGLRALAAIIVLNNHFVALLMPCMFNYAANSEHFAWEKLFSTTPLFFLINGQTSVILFFILSGYLIST